MGALHLHPACWNGPNRLFQVELFPGGVAELARAHEGEGEEREGYPGLGLPLIVLQGPQKGPEAPFVGDGCPVMDPWGSQCAAEAARGVVLTPRRGDGIHRAAIMRDAHKRFRDGRRLNLGWSFAECLATAWAAAKIRRAATLTKPATIRAESPVLPSSSGSPTLKASPAPSAARKTPGPRINWPGVLL